MGEFQVTEQKKKSKYQRSIDWSIVDLGENRAAVEKPEQEMANSLLHRRDVMAILSTGFGKSMIFTVFAMAKEEMSSLKTCMCMITISPLKCIIDKQILEMLMLSSTAMEFTIETDSLLLESPPQFSLLPDVIEGVFKTTAQKRRPKTYDPLD